MREKLLSLFCLKINREYQQFKKNQLKLSAEDIYMNAYEIQCYMSLYESMLEMSQDFTENELISLVTFPEVLAFLYGEWLRVEDSSQKELDDYLKNQIEAIHNELFERKEVVA